jgi:hypothetical protein
MGGSKWMTIGDFLIRRLREAGVQIEDSGAVDCVGACNELNGAYAADGYARLNGLGAVVVTHGVGALSAVNGVAGAYSEHVPVICVAGAIPVVAREHNLLLHHTFAGGGRGEFLRAYAQVTAATAGITPQNAVMEIDRLIHTAWRSKRPVDMELPSDVAYLEVEVPSEPLELAVPASAPERLGSAVVAVAERLAVAETPAVLVDCDADRFGVAADVVELSQRLGAAVAVVNTARGVVDDSFAHFAGVYPAVPGAREAIEGSDGLLAIGYRSVESTTGFFADSLPEATTQARAYSVDASGENYQSVSLPAAEGAAREGDGRRRPGGAERTAASRARREEWCRVRSPDPGLVLAGDPDVPAPGRRADRGGRHLGRRSGDPRPARRKFVHHPGHLRVDRLHGRLPARHPARRPRAATRAVRGRRIVPTDGPGGVHHPSARPQAGHLPDQQPGLHHRAHHPRQGRPLQRRGGLKRTGSQI